MEELMIEIMHEDNINMAWYSFIHEGIECRGFVEFEEDEEENDAFENESKELEVEYDYEIDKEDGRYVVKSDGASITIYASTLSKLNLDCTLRQAEEKLQHREPMRRRGRMR